MGQIELSDGSVVLVDDEDRSKVFTSSYKDKDDGNIYSVIAVGKCPCCGAIKNVRSSLARYIMQLDSDDPRIVIHRNRNKLDFRRKNLQIVTRQQELFRHGLQSNNQSGYKGVYWFGSRGKWRALIGYNEKRLHIGYFNSKKDAAIAYNRRAIELFGEFAELNQIDD